LSNRQVNAPLRRSSDLPYGFSRPPILSRTPAALRVSGRLPFYMADTIVAFFFNRERSSTRQVSCIA